MARALSAAINETNGNRLSDAEAYDDCAIQMNVRGAEVPAAPEVVGWNPMPLQNTQPPVGAPGADFFCADSRNRPAKVE